MEEERIAELEEDDMLYTYTKEDGMNQVQKRKPRGRPRKEKKSLPLVEPSRKSKRPPRPKQFISPASEIESDQKPPVKRGRGRPRKYPLPVESVAQSRVITVKSGSSADMIALKKKSGSQTFIISPVNASSFPGRQVTNGVRRRSIQQQSDTSDIDV